MTSISVFAQNQIKGTVTDSKGEPMYGVTIAVKNGKQTAVTDLEGRFTINVADGAVTEVANTTANASTISSMTTAASTECMN